MSSKRKSSKGPAVATIIVVVLVAHSIVTGHGTWLAAAVLALGALVITRLVRRFRRGKGVYFRKSIKVLPFTRLNISRSPSKGWGHSWSTKVGPWSRNSKRRGDRVDLPGGFHWQ